MTTFTAPLLIVRDIAFSLDPTSDRYRPRINWDAIKDKIQTRLYFRKMVKGAGGKMVASQNRHDIFSVVIEPNKWTLNPVSNGHLKLGVDQLMEIEVPSAPDQNAHPFLPSSEFPKTSPETSPGTNGEWQVAAILSMDLNGDFSKGEDGKFGYDLAQSGGYFPEQYILDKLGTQGAYEEHDKEFDDTKDLQDAKPFKYDGYWMLYPKTMYFDHDTPNPAEAQAMEIPFCADWKDVEIDENGIVGVQLQAKSPGMILHYELIPDDVDAKPDPTSISSARGLNLASRRAKQSFRSPGASIGIEDFTELSQDALDNLRSTACTFYGALWYDQDGKTVHWSRGQIDLTAYKSDPDDEWEDRFFMKENTLSVYVRSAEVSQSDLEIGAHCHMLYFVMPPYEGTSAPADAKTTFWLQPRVQSKQISKYDSDAAFAADQPSPYKYLPLSYKLKKKNGTFQNQYVSTTPLSPGKIHWVRLQYKKLDAPIPFDPDAQP